MLQDAQGRPGPGQRAAERMLPALPRPGEALAGLEIGTHRALARSRLEAHSSGEPGAADAERRLEDLYV